jgi:dolichyl-phosphate-mannose-protein mannosyltransferase
MRRDRWLLAAVLGLMLVLGVWGNRWGAPAHWHGDEVYLHARRLVETRTLDTHKYSYGLLSYYTVALFAIAPLRLYDRAFDPRPHEAGAMADSAWSRRDQVREMRASRTVSAVEAGLLVLAIWWVGAMAVGDDAALVAAILLAFNPVLVTLAHFATVDIGATLCYYAACGCTLRYLEAPDRRWLLAAGLVGGLAVGLKADRLTIVAPLLAAFVFGRPRGRMRDLVQSSLLLPAGFVIANPVLLTSAFDYVDGFTRELWYNGLRTPRIDFRPILGYVADALGWPLIALVIIAGTYGVVRLHRRKGWRITVWFGAVLLPYAYLLGRTDKPWYALMVLPPLLLLGAFGAAEWIRQAPRPIAAAGSVVVAALGLWSLYRSVMIVGQFVNDPRYDAGRWIADHAPAHSVVEMVGYGPALPLGRYDIRAPVRLELCDDAVAPLERLDHTPAYQRFRATLERLERWSGAHLGTRVRPHPYRAWFDVFAERCAAPPPMEEGEPDFLVVVGAGKTKDLTPDQVAAGFGRVARFDYPQRGLRGPPLGFVNLPVTVFARTAPGESPSPER